jgi:hypothetical protein
MSFIDMDIEAFRRKAKEMRDKAAATTDTVLKQEYIRLSAAYEQLITDILRKGGGGPA